MFLILVLIGTLAGFIDSIVGGGGLITVPTLSLILGPGVEAIATNKMGAAASTLIAVLIYFRKGHVRFTGNLGFVLAVGLSSAVGAYFARFIPPVIYKWFIVAIVPVVLFVILNKELWVTRVSPPGGHRVNRGALWACALLCGFYDGIAGPGGGTVMFLSLLMVARMPLLPAIGTAKLANLASASIALTTFALSGQVQWAQGTSLALGLGLGAAVGASVVSQNASVWARAALICVSLLLILRLFISG